MREYLKKKIENPAYLKSDMSKVAKLILKFFSGFSNEYEFLKMILYGVRRTNIEYLR